MESVRWPTRDLVAHRARATPERTAVVDPAEGREWTYRDFDAVVEGTAARLEHLLGVSEGQVGLLASTRVGFFVVVHACHRRGHTVVPLDAKLTGRELRARLDRVDLDLLVCEAATEERATAESGSPIVSLEDSERVESLEPRQPADDPTVTSAPRERTTPRWTRSDTAVVMFTSGTTGDPKGVRLTMGNLVASATGSAFRLGVSPGDRWLCCLPAYHMGGLAPGFRCPLYGTTLVVQGDFEAEATARALAATGATGVSLVPTQLRRLLETDWEPSSALETVLLGGAPASLALLERALDAGVPVYPTYGLTEAASQVATARPSDVAADPETVGQPLVVTEVTVVDEDGRPLDSGETGELVVDGPTVTPGYLDADRTDDARGEFGLHTGDIGYRDEDGHLRVLGRVDDTVVTGGENVHPSEVEAALTDHPGVEAAAVVGLADEEWGQRVGALVVPAADRPAVEDLDAHLRERLAGYKLPKTVDFVRSLPRTASGTVDRAAVRDRLRN